MPPSYTTYDDDEVSTVGAIGQMRQALRGKIIFAFVAAAAALGTCVHFASNNPEVPQADSTSQSRAAAPSSDPRTQAALAAIALKKTREAEAAARDAETTERQKRESREALGASYSDLAAEHLKGYKPDTLRFKRADAKPSGQ